RSPAAGSAHRSSPQIRAQRIPGFRVYTAAAHAAPAGRSQPHIFLLLLRSAHTQDVRSETISPALPPSQQAMPPPASDPQLPLRPAVPLHAPRFSPPSPFTVSVPSSPSTSRSADSELSRHPTSGPRKIP